MKNTLVLLFSLNLLFNFLSLSNSSANPNYQNGWNVDCGNHCNFSEFPNNCQGVFYQYPDGSQSYSSWSTQYNACQEFAPLNANTHIISLNQIQCNCPTPTKYPPTNPTAPLTAATKAQLEVLRSQVYSWTMCAPDPSANYSNLFTPFDYHSIRSCQYFRKRNLKHTYTAIGGCYNGLLGFEDGDWHVCDFNGDQLTNTAENCMFGDQTRCNEIKDAQDPITGMWYRNHYHRLHPETSNAQPLFSRDGLMGLLSYVGKNNDKEALKKWLVFVSNNVKSPPIGLFNICPPRPNIPKPEQVTQQAWDGMLYDDRCSLVPSAAGLVYRTAITVGFTDDELKTLGIDFYSALKSGALTVPGTLLGEGISVPIHTYQSGDTADAIFIALSTQGGGSRTLVNAATHLDDRSARLNPGYHFLATNRTPTEYGAYLINKYCKASSPQYGFWFDSGYKRDNNSSGYWNNGVPFIATNYQWAGGWAGAQKSVPTGHDCIAWLNMYLQNGNYTQAQCESGDQFINGACKKFAFTTPSLAAIPGIDYQFNAGTAKLHYVAKNMIDCPYGGSLVTGDWPNFARCYLPSGLTTNQVQWNVSYQVDPTESNPNISYQKVNGACPYGGTSSGNKCVVKTYASPVISQFIHYSVNTNPSSAGVYYQKINGSCSWGGTPTGDTCLIQSLPAKTLNTSTQYFVRANPAYPGVYYYPAATVPETTYSAGHTGPEVFNPGVVKSTGTPIPATKKP